MRILSVLFAAFPESNLDEGTRADRLRGYLTALEGAEPVVLEEAVKMVLQGKAEVRGERLNPRFAPTPPQLALLCEEVRHLRFVRSRPQLVYESSAPADPISPEEQERRRLHVEEITKNLFKAPE